MARLLKGNGETNDTDFSSLHNASG